jgi:hypothetical protein
VVKVACFDTDSQVLILKGLVEGYLKRGKTAKEGNECVMGMACERSSGESCGMIAIFIHKVNN